MKTGFLAIASYHLAKPENVIRFATKDSTSFAMTIRLILISICQVSLSKLILSISLNSKKIYVRFKTQKSYLISNKFNDKFQKLGKEE